MSSEVLIQNKPKQSRSQKTLERLLDSAQDLLVEGGFEAVNSNAVVEGVGMTPPAFYHYFKNKHDLLRILCERLMAAQNDILSDDNNWDDFKAGNLQHSARKTLKQTIEVTKNFKGGYVLLQLLRAIPELKPIRINSHNEMAKVMANMMRETKAVTSKEKEQLEIRARITIEMGYSAVEMLFDTNFKNQDIVFDIMSASMASIYQDILDD